MNSKEIIKTLMKERGFTLQHLADEAGFNSRMAVSQRLTTGSAEMRVDTLVRLLEAMDCELVVKSKLKDRKEWKVG